MLFEDDDWEEHKFVHLGAWTMSLDGSYEARAVVAESKAGFLAGISESRLGGDVPGVCLNENVFPSKDLALSAAEIQLNDWHREISQCRS